MSLIKRISASITTTMDKAVRKVENHDAIIDAALRESQQAAARTRVRLARVRQDGAGLNRRKTELATAITQWTERAKNTAHNDETRALQCLRRRKECERQARNLDDSIANHHELETRITDNLKKIEARITQVSQQRNVMRSRQSVAEAMRVINSIEGVSCGEIEETFDRWEINLCESEVRFGGDTGRDTLETEFLHEEDEAALRAELADLTGDDNEVA